MMFFKNVLNKFLYKFIIFIITFYQKIISPIIPARCRYYPTCSHYGKQAVMWHGVGSGSWLLLKRIGRCHPLGGHGIDFVPLPLASYQYYRYDSVIFNAGGAVYRDNSSYTARLNHLMSV